MTDPIFSPYSLILSQAITLAKAYLAAQSVSLEYRSLVNALSLEAEGGGWVLIWMTAEQIERYRTTPQLRGGGALKVTVSEDEEVSFTFER